MNCKNDGGFYRDVRDLGYGSFLKNRPGKLKGKINNIYLINIFSKSHSTFITNILKFFWQLE